MDSFKKWLNELTAGERLSIYLSLPFVFMVAYLACLFIYHYPLVGSFCITLCLFLVGVTLAEHEAIAKNNRKKDK